MKRSHFFAISATKTVFLETLILLMLNGVRAVPYLHEELMWPR